MEQAHEEASRLQTKIKQGEAKNYSTAETQIEAEKLMENPEDTLQKFINTPLSQAQIPEDWEARLRFNIKNRLVGKPDKRYLFGLRQSARAMSEEKEKILTAAFLYELQHRAEIQAVPNYNQTVLFRMVLNLIKEESGLLAEAVQKHVETVPLGEIYGNFRGAKNITPDDLPTLSELAMSRLAKPEDADAAKQVLADTTTDLFRPVVNTKAKKLNVLGFFDPLPLSGKVGKFSAERYSSPVLNYVLGEVKQSDPAFFDKLVEEIDYRVLYGSDIPFDEAELDKKFERTDYHGRERLRRERHMMTILIKMVESVPVLGAAYDELHVAKRLEKEKKAREQEEATRKATEEQVRLSAESEQERRRMEVEQNRVYQEERLQKKEKANKECDQIMAELPRYTAGAEISDEQIRNKVETTDTLKLNKLWEADDWEVIQHGNEPIKFKLDNLEHSVCNFLIQEADNTKKDALETTWSSKKTEFRTSIRSLLELKKDIIYDAIDNRLSFKKIDPTINDYEEYSATLKVLLENIGSMMERAPDDSTRQFLQGIVAIAEKKQIAIFPAYESAKTKIEEREKREAMINAQEEYLLEQVEQQTSYLKEIYSIGTNLGLAYVESSASREMGEMVGSTSLRMRQNLKQVLRLELKLELLPEQDSITLEMGDNLESIKKRLAMVNWVVPHEVAHLVDIATDMHKRLFTEAELKPMVSLIENWRGNKPELAKEMIPFIVKETVIDGVGYRLLKEHGSANPLEESKAERVAAALRGYVAMMDVLEHILNTNAEDEEIKARYSVILLREIADGQIIVDEARSNKVDPKIIRAAEREISKLNKAFSQFNRETRFIHEDQIGDIVDLFKNYFQKAEQVPLVPRSREE